MTYNPQVDVEQMLAHGRDYLARFDQCYRAQGDALSTEDLFGSLMAYLITHGDEWTHGNLTILAAAAIIERYRAPVPLPPV